jgi:predicted RNA-binding protein YlqC (UPF0109 family)
MSAFDDEFGLFGEGSDEPERRPALGARRIASDAALGDVEFEERPSRLRTHRPARRSRQSAGDPWAGHRRAAELLAFLARKLVQKKPDAVTVDLFMDEHREPVIELVVDPDDLGKVVGRDGRVARALRTITRATAEGRVSVDILDTDEAAAAQEEDGDAVE